jgi:hypothetical protein
MTTSVGRRRRRSAATPTRPNTATPTLPIAGFPIQHASHRLPAQGATVTLPVRVRPHGKELITARSLTALYRKIFRNCRWALALALVGHRQILHRRCRDECDALPITPTLLASACLAGVAVSPTSTGLRSSPSPRSLLACCATISALRPAWPIVPFAAFKQAAPLTKMP